MVGLRIPLCVGLFVATVGHSTDWDVVDFLIQNFSFVPNMAFSAGDKTGRKHTMVKGNFSMKKQIIMASSSKFPAGIAIAGAVVDGHLKFDTLANEVFPWWTTDETDVRSRVTLRHLLTFTSGMVSSDFADGGSKCINDMNDEPEKCARKIYEEFAYQGMGNMWVEPGTIWSYHSNHLQIAGSMAAKATNLTVKAVLEKYLIHRLNMTDTFWYGYPNPHLAATMVTTGDDYDKLLQAVLRYEIAPKAIIDQMEEDAYRHYPGLNFSFYPKDTSLGYYGHYSMCTYFECVSQSWGPTCENAGVHADPGAFGYWPLIDRSKEYYMQLVVYRPVTFPDDIMKKYHIPADALAALPGHCVGPLRFETGFFVEQALFNNSNGNDFQRRFDASTATDPDPLAPLCKLAELYPPPVSESTGSTAEVFV
jgi:CubicO group peptidase (beta-lactamase class C family)